MLNSKLPAYSVAIPVWRSYLATMAHGICKITNGWGNQDSAWVRYGDGTKLEVPEDKYREAGHTPPFEQLPECKGEQDT
ncbi:hypothetical protein ACVINW_001429 [Bradyrhizobium sp. USDA 4461]